MFRVQKASLNMFWEYSPSSVNLASDWLRVDRIGLSITLDEEEIKIKIKMDNRVASYFTCFRGILICSLVGGAALSLGHRMI